MRTEPYFDPLDAGEELLRYITEQDRTELKLTDLALHLDSFLYAIRFLFKGGVASIWSVDDDPPRDLIRNGLREKIASRFPGIGLYWEALSSKMEPDVSPEIAAGDAIDDLLDIAAELFEVRWYLENFGRDEALAALRWRYENHLHMHLLPLRAHLEELIHYDWGR